MQSAVRPVIIVETPSSPFGHRYLVLPDRVVDDGQAARFCSRLDREGFSAGVDWIGVSRLGTQKAFGGGRTGFQRAVLADVDIAALTPEKRVEIESHLNLLLDRLDAIVTSMDWKDGETNLVVTSPELATELKLDLSQLPTTRKPSFSPVRRAVPRPAVLLGAGALGLLLIVLVIMNRKSENGPEPAVANQGEAKTTQPDTSASVATKPDGPVIPTAPTTPEDAPNAELVVEKITWETIKAKLDADSADSEVLDLLSKWRPSSKIERGQYEDLSKYFVRMTIAQVKHDTPNGPGKHALEKIAERMRSWKKTKDFFGKSLVEKELLAVFCPMMLKEVENYLYKRFIDETFRGAGVVLLDPSDTRANEGLIARCSDYDKLVSVCLTGFDGDIYGREVAGMEFEESARKYTENNSPLKSHRDSIKTIHKKLVEKLRSEIDYSKCMLILPVRRRDGADEEPPQPNGKWRFKSAKIRLNQVGNPGVAADRANPNAANPDAGVIPLNVVEDYVRLGKSIDFVGFPHYLALVRDDPAENKPIGIGYLDLILDFQEGRQRPGDLQYEIPLHLAMPPTQTEWYLTAARSFSTPLDPTWKEFQFQLGIKSSPVIFLPK